jgi:hypothetical protein
VAIPGINFEFGDRILEITDTNKVSALGKIMPNLAKFKSFWMK